MGVPPCSDRSRRPRCREASVPLDLDRLCARRLTLERRDKRSVPYRSPTASGGSNSGLVIGEGSFYSPAKRGRWRRSRRRGRRRGNGLPISPSSAPYRPAGDRDAPCVTARIRTAPPPPLRRGGEDGLPRAPALCSTQPQANSNVTKGRPASQPLRSAAARRRVKVVPQARLRHAGRPDAPDTVALRVRLWRRRSGRSSTPSGHCSVAANCEVKRCQGDIALLDDAWHQD